MAKAKKVCRVCGKSYIACCTPNPTGMFRWHDVACSRECGSIYLEKIMASRTETSNEDLGNDGTKK